MALVRTSREAAASPNYTQADVEALSKTLNDPQWLRESRLAAWELYTDLPLPGRDDEVWRRSDYRSIRWATAGSLLHNTTATAGSIPAVSLEPLISDRQGAMLAFVDDRVVIDSSSDELTAQGVVVTDLVTACRDHEALIRPHLMTRAVMPSDGKFAALHAALWTHGVFVYVPRNIIAEAPIHVVMMQSQPGATLGHVLIVVEDGAQATVVVDYLSPVQGDQSAYIGATELLVGKNATLRYVGLQDWNRTTYEFSHQRAVVDRDGQLDWIMGTIGGRFVKAFIEIDLVGQGANGRASGMFFADKNQFFDHDTQQNHNAPLTTSDLLFKGAAKDKSRTLWQGMIKSLPQMQKIDGFQACRNLLLSEDARMDAIPGLEIEADDVRCTHAATFGTLEEQPVFYLMSRGIDRAQAELMVTEGFFEELLERIPFEAVQDRLRAALEAKIIGVA